MGVRFTATDPNNRPRPKKRHPRRPLPSRYLRHRRRRRFRKGSPEETAAIMWVLRLHEIQIAELEREIESFRRQQEEQSN